MPQSWVRGPATFDARTGMLAIEAASAEEYEFPSNDLVLPMALARVDGAESARSFVSSYGLLRRGSIKERLEEPLEDLLQAAATVRVVLALWGGLRSDEYRPELEVLVRRLRDADSEVAAVAGPPPRNEVELVNQAARILGYAATMAMSETVEQLIPVAGAPDAFAIGLWARDLRARAFRELANVIVGYKEIRSCKACRSWFLGTDPRQVFCSRRCQYRFNKAERRAEARKLKEDQGG